MLEQRHTKVIRQCWKGLIHQSVGLAMMLGMLQDEIGYHQVRSHTHLVCLKQSPCQWKHIIEESHRCAKNYIHVCSDSRSWALDIQIAATGVYFFILYSNVLCFVKFKINNGVVTCMQECTYVPSGCRKPKHSKVPVIGSGILLAK